jgi:hypothetical protein
MQASQFPAGAAQQQKPAGVTTGGLFVSRLSLGRAEQHQNDDERDRKAQKIENDRHSELLCLC